MTEDADNIDPLPCLGFMFILNECFRASHTAVIIQSVEIPKVSATEELGLAIEAKLGATGLDKALNSFNGCHSS